jgi:hypothetical protein
MKKLILFLILSSLNLFAAGKFEIETHQEMFDYLKNNKLLGEQTLIVFDIDNTLLKSKHLLGSDQWFNWQNTELSLNSTESIAKDFPELLEIQQQLFSLGEMDLVESEIIKYLKEYREEGISMIALTSRGPEMQQLTFRELNKSLISFDQDKIGHDLTPEFNIPGATQKLLYQDGVFMTSGAHKGIMLDFLLSKFSANFKHIIFIDDHAKHTDRVYQSLSEKGLDITTFRYAHEDASVKSFQSSDKREVKSLTKKLLQIRDTLRSPNN